MPISSHTHSCPKCGTVTIHFCYGRNAGLPDCPPVCEHFVDAPDESLLCEECHEQLLDEEAEAARVDRLWKEWVEMEHIDPMQAVLMGLKGGQR